MFVFPLASVMRLQWISADGTEMMMVSTACCNFSTSDPLGYVPKEGGYQAHWTPVRLKLKGWVAMLVGKQGLPR